MKTIEIYVRFVAHVPDDVAGEIEQGKTEPYCIDLPLAQCHLLKSTQKPGENPAHTEIESKFVEFETMELTTPAA